MRDKFKVTDLPIVSWNIHGLFTRQSGFRYNKLDSPFFQDAINRAKIFALIETHHTASEIDQIQLDGFKCYNVCRKKKHFGRNSGGIAVYVHETILKGVQKIPSSGSENVLIKLKQSFFGLSRDVVVCFSYCVPEYSSFQVREQLDVYGDLELKLSSLGQHVDKLCFGDYNARTGTKLDYLESEDNTDIPVPLDIYETDIMTDLPRLNMDKGTNKYGDNLLTLCKTVPLRICNGRKLGDILGSYTCYTPNGQSCVDYCLVSPRLYDSVKTLSVGEISTLSDHCPVRAVLKVKVHSERTPENYTFIENPKKLQWNKDISYRFENILQSPEYALKIDNFMSTQIEPSQQDIDRATQNLTGLLVEGTLKADWSIKHEKQSNNTTKKKKKRKFSHPKWHDISCYESHRKVSTTAKLLKGDPKNAFLRGKLITETKEYNKLVKYKNKQFVENMFTELDSMENNNPRGYMELVRSMRDGSFDKSTSDDTSGISPSTWHSHFSNLLSKKIDPMDKINLEQLVKNNIDSLENELNEPFSVIELATGLKELKNNKASSFDRVSNEMLKTSGKILKNAFLHLFNLIRMTSFYPTLWKKDILHPIHKSDVKDDPNNFRGIAIASCFGKLFTKLLKNRLQTFCDKNNFISKVQGSGKKSSRTSDHLMVIKFLIDKIVKGERKKLYACFVDIQKAFDCTNRQLLFYKLMTEYNVGGSFLKILQSLYDNHQVYVRLSEGLLQPILTTIGLKQGCGISPLLFNLFINKLPDIFDQTCDPVKVGDEDLSSLLWADDLVLLSSTPQGLQNSIDKTYSFYNELGLEMNKKKTKVIVFNVRGIKLTDNLFSVGGSPLEIVDNYQYLGIKLKPSGSLQFASGELLAKANRAWFAISNVLYQHKKLAVKKALQLFDSLIRPIFSYAVEFWLPFLIPKKAFENQNNLLKFWETFQPEILNQRVCRLLLSVHKRCSRLAVLGELGRYPVLLPAIKHCLKYQYQLERIDKSSLIYKALSDMQNNQQIDSWYSRVEKIKSLLSIKRLYCKPEKAGNIIDKNIKSKFDRFFLNEINQTKLGPDGCDHNKLRLYKTLKGSFSQEPYITNIKNRNQRAWLSRYRTSAHNLRIELGRYTRPVTPLSDRKCLYCLSGNCDTEQHFILFCETFKLKRQCFFGRMSVLYPEFMTLSDEQKLCVILCPSTTEIAKCVSKYLGIMTTIRKEIDGGLSPNDLQHYIEHKAET